MAQSILAVCRNGNLEPSEPPTGVPDNALLKITVEDVAELSVDQQLELLQ